MNKDYFFTCKMFDFQKIKIFIPLNYITNLLIICHVNLLNKSIKMWLYFFMLSI